MMIPHLTWFVLPALSKLGTRGSPADVSHQSLEESLTSLRSSILDYRRENGRTYHRLSDGSEWVGPRVLPSSAANASPMAEYVLPNDEVYFDTSPRIVL